MGLTEIRTYTKNRNRGVRHMTKNTSGSASKRCESSHDKKHLWKREQKVESRYQQRLSTPKEMTPP